MEFFAYLLFSIYLLWLLQPSDNDQELSAEEKIKFNLIQANETLKKFNENVSKLEKFYENNQKNTIKYEGENYTTYTYF